MDILIGYESALDYWRTVVELLARLRCAASGDKTCAACARFKRATDPFRGKSASCRMHPAPVHTGGQRRRPDENACRAQQLLLRPPREVVRRRGRGLFDEHAGVLLLADGEPAVARTAHNAGIRVVRNVRPGRQGAGTASRRAADDGRQAANVRRRRLERSREEEGAAGFALRVGPIGLADGVCAGHAAVPAVRLGRVRITRTAT